MARKRENLGNICLDIGKMPKNGNIMCATRNCCTVSSWPLVLRSVWELSFGKIGSAARVPGPSRDPKKAVFRVAQIGKIIARAVSWSLSFSMRK